MQIPMTWMVFFSRRASQTRTSSYRKAKMKRVRKVGMERKKELFCLVSFVWMTLDSNVAKMYLRGG